MSPHQRRDMIQGNCSNLRSAMSWNSKYKLYVSTVTPHLNTVWSPKHLFCFYSTCLHQRHTNSHRRKFSLITSGSDWYYFISGKILFLHLIGIDFILWATVRMWLHYDLWVLLTQYLLTEFLLDRVQLFTARCGVSLVFYGEKTRTFLNGAAVNLNIY